MINPEETRTATNGQEWPRMEKIVTDCKWLQNISLV